MLLLPELDSIISGLNLDPLCTGDILNTFAAKLISAKLVSAVDHVKLKNAFT